MSEIYRLVKEAWDCSHANGYLPETPKVEAQSLADQDYHIEMWLNAGNDETERDRRYAMLEEAVINLLAVRGAAT